MRSPFEDRYFPSNCASIKREKWLPSTCPHTWHLKRSSYLQIRRIFDHPKPTNLLIIFSKWVANQKKNFFGHGEFLITKIKEIHLFWGEFSFLLKSISAGYRFLHFCLFRSFLSECNKNIWHTWKASPSVAIVAKLK